MKLVARLVLVGRLLDLERHSNALLRGSFFGLLRLQCGVVDVLVRKTVHDGSDIRLADGVLRTVVNVVLANGARVFDVLGAIENAEGLDATADGLREETLLVLEARAFLHDSALLGHGVGGRVDLFVLSNVSLVVIVHLHESGLEVIKLRDLHKWHVNALRLDGGVVEGLQVEVHFALVDAEVVEERGAGGQERLKTKCVNALSASNIQCSFIRIFINYVNLPCEGTVRQLRSRSRVASSRRAKWRWCLPFPSSKCA